MIKKLVVFLILLNIHFNIIKLFIFYLKYKYVILQKRGDKYGYCPYVDEKFG